MNKQQKLEEIEKSIRKELPYLMELRLNDFLKYVNKRFKKREYVSDVHEMFYLDEDTFEFDIREGEFHFWFYLKNK